MGNRSLIQIIVIGGAPLTLQFKVAVLPFSTTFVAGDSTTRGNPSGKSLSAKIQNIQIPD